MCLVATTVTAYPQKQSPLARLFPSNRQASLDDFNYLQHGTSISNPQNRPSAPAAPTTTNRPCIPVQYRRSHPNGIAADDSIDTKITFYLANPTNRPYPYRPAANVAASGAAAAYNSYSGYHCDQTVSYRPFWLDIANLFGIFGAANGQQPESTPTNGIRPVHEDGESSNAVSRRISKTFSVFSDRPIWSKI